MNGASYFQLLNPLICMIFAGGFVAIYRRDRRLKSAALLAASYALASIGFLLDFLVRDAVGPYAGSFVSNVPLLLSILLCASAAHERYGAPLPLRAGAVVTTFTFMAVGGAIWAYGPHSFERALAMNTGAAAAFALALPPLWRKRRETVARVLLVLFALSAAQCVFRTVGVSLSVGVHDEAVSYSNSLYALTLHFTSALSALSLATTFFFALGVDLVLNLDRRAKSDPLTGLLNRDGLAQDFARVAAECFPRGLPVSVIVADIDRFKSINDTFGHAAGDTVIAALARLLKEADPSATVARLGGEEFVAVLPRADVAAARLYAEGVRTAFAALRMNEVDAPVSASFGVAGIREGRASEALAHALRAADAALYRAKETGRDRTCLAGLSVDAEAATDEAAIKAA